MPYWFDGNNLIGQTTTQARGDRETRRAFLRCLGDYAAARGGRFMVFFDGDDPDREIPPRGVRIRFSAPLSADDAILNGLAGAQNAAETIVVTNDSELRRRCRDAGARTMDWKQFRSVMQKATVAPRGHAKIKKDDPVDIDEWARYLGLDEDSLD